MHFVRTHNHLFLVAYRNHIIKLYLSFGSGVFMCRGAQMKLLLTQRVPRGAYAFFGGFSTDHIISSFMDISRRSNMPWSRAVTFAAYGISWERMGKGEE